MADQGFEQDFLRDFLEEAAAVSPLANNEKTFRSVFGAFRKGDAKAFQAALKAARLLPRCHLICRWLRVKESILLCLELCGPPKEITRPNPRRLAEAIVKITSDEKVVAQLAAAVEKRDRAAFQRIAKQYELGPCATSSATGSAWCATGWSAAGSASRTSASDRASPPSSTRRVMHCGSCSTTGSTRRPRPGGLGTPRSSARSSRTPASSTSATSTASGSAAGAVCSSA